MKIPEKTWVDYINRLSRIDKTATDKMIAYMNRVPGILSMDPDALIEFAYGVSTKYGEAAAALACEMYEAVAEASGVTIETAVPAETAGYGEVAKAVSGTAKTGNIETVAGAVGRLVKRAGVDTTMKNAIRDGAEWAWIPHGDTCAFCLTLASRGWQKASEKALKGGHAEHIHSHCDCTYEVRFNEDTQYEGYDPDQYLEMYESAEGNTSAEKINSMRRAQYARDKDRINAQKRAAYAKRHGDKFHKNKDPLLEIFGPAEKSHPQEIEEILARANNLGVEVKEDSEGMAYAPGLQTGQPGQLHISRKDSIGAWRHEEQHMNDDANDGFLGFSGLFDVERRSRMEYNAYRQEIMLAKQANRMDIVSKLKELCREEIEKIGGVWDEAKLE